MGESSATSNEAQEFETLLARGSDLLQEDDVEGARTCFEEALSAQPDDEKVLGLLGLTHFRLADFEAASVVYRKLVEKNSSDASYRLNLGLVHLKLGRADEAIEELSQARTLDPSQVRTVSYLGLAYARNGGYAQAYEAFLQADESGLASEMEQYLDEEVQQDIRQRVSGVSDANSSEQEPMFTSEDQKDATAEEPANSSAIPSASGEEGMITRAVEKVIPSEAATGEVRLRTPDSDSASAIETNQTGRRVPLQLSEFAQQRLLRPQESKATLEIGAGGVLIAQVKGKLISRTHGVMVSSGDLGYEPATKRIRGRQTDEVFGNGQAKLFLVTGQGYMVASACGEVFTALRLSDDILYLREEYVFAFEPGLRWENGRVPGSEFHVAQFRGEGYVAMRTPKELLSIRLAQEKVLYVESDVLAGWIGNVIPRVVKPAAGGLSSTAFVECSGDGVVLMHDLQGSE